jgi:hypothetical protein
MISTIPWIAVLCVLFVLLGRYSLEIRFSRSGAGSDLRLSLRSLASILGVDYHFSESRVRIVFFGGGIVFPARKRSGAMDSEAESEPRSVRSETGEKRRIRVSAFGKWIRRGLPFLKKAVREFRFERLDMNLRFGTGDPASTGMLYGLAQCVLSIPVERCRAELTPDFTERKLEGRAELAVRFVLIRLVAILVVEGIRLKFALWRSAKRAVPAVKTV